VKYATEVIHLQRLAVGGVYAASGVGQPTNVELGPPAINFSTKQPATNAKNFERFIPYALDYLLLM
jgi:hypothetical protein